MTTTTGLADEGTFAEIKAIAFDHSGTISDDIIATHRAATIAGASYGIAVECDPIAWGLRAQSSAKTDILARAAMAREMGDVALAGRLAAITPDAFAEMFRRTLRIVVHGVTPGGIGRCVPTPIGDSVGALRKLRHAVGDAFPIAVISAHPQDLLTADLVRYGIAGGIFTKIQGDCFNKTDALIAFARTNGLDPKCVAYVGDTIGDMHAAQCAGVVSIAATCGYHSREMMIAMKPRFVFDDVAQFVDRFVTAVQTR